MDEELVHDLNQLKGETSGGYEQIRDAPHNNLVPPMEIPYEKLLLEIRHTSHTESSVKQAARDLNKLKTRINRVCHSREPGSSAGFGSGPQEIPRKKNNTKPTTSRSRGSSRVDIMAEDVKARLVNNLQCCRFGAARRNHCKQDRFIHC